MTFNSLLFLSKKTKASKSLISGLIFSRKSAKTVPLKTQVHTTCQKHFTYYASFNPHQDLRSENLPFLPQYRHEN